MARLSPELLLCRGVACGYPDQEPILSGVDLTAQRAEILAILGGSGSGKSTLLKTLAGLLQPRAGSVRWLGEDPYALEGAQRRRVMRRAGMLFQHDALFGSMSVLENIALPVLELTRIPKPVAYEMARARLALVKLSQLEQRFPSELSGGQRKRVALARATVLDPVILFCDEPTSGLDPATARHVDETLMRFRDVLRVTVIAVTHDVEGVRAFADRAIVLQDGKVCAEGAIDTLERSTQPAVRAFFHRKSARATTTHTRESAGQP